MRYGNGPLKLGTLALGVLLASNLTAAQQTQTEGNEPRRATVLEEVTVTAQRKQENAQDVAISMTVFSQEQIANANMANSNDIATYTPSMTTNTRFGPENATFSIRGFTRSLRTTASVGVYLAEVIAPRGQTSQTSGDGAGPGTLFDLANVQVLKGPQGTLFGRNTTGGSILLTPQQPTQEFEGYLEASAGNYSSERLQGVINLPITDNLAIRAGIDANERNGHLNNIAKVGGDELGNVNYVAGRFSVLWDITDNVSNYTLIQASDSDTNGYTSRLFACNNQPSEFFSVAIGIFTNAGCNQQLESQAANGKDGYYDIVSTVPDAISVIEETRLINTTTWQVNDSITVKNIFAYSHLLTENGSDVFGTDFPEVTYNLLGPVVDLLPLDLITDAIADPDREFGVGLSIAHPDYPVTDQSTWVEEIQVQGISLDSRLEWQAGLYYEESLPEGPSGNISAGTIACDFSTLTGDPSQYNCFDISAGQLGSVLINDFRTEYKNRAIYAQGSYDLVDSVTLTAGLRYTHDETEARGKKVRYAYVGSIQQAPTTQISKPRQVSEAPTGVLEVQYRPIADAVMLYAKYSRGYRQGSVNPAADPGVDVFDQEEVDTYEIGAKTQFGGPVPGRFNIAVFDNDFTDMQLQTGYISSGAAQTVAIFNAGKSKITGVEADLSLQLTSSLLANISYSYLDTELLEQDENSQKIQDAAGGIAGFSATPIADVGDELPFAPDQSVVASLLYQVPVPAKYGLVDFSTTYVYTGQQRAGASSGSPFSMLDAFELWNFNLSWAGVMGTNLDFSAFLTNAFDEEYETYVSATFNVLGFDSRMSGMPKMYGARLRWNF